jgi:hypothetical protein
VALLWCKHLLLNRKKITGEKLWKPQHEIVMPLLSVSGTPYFGGKSMHEQSRSFEFQPPNQYGMSVIQRNDAIKFECIHVHRLESEFDFSHIQSTIVLFLCFLLHVAESHMVYHVDRVTLLNHSPSEEGCDSLSFVEEEKHDFHILTQSFD